MYDVTTVPATEFRLATQSDIITAARLIFESYAPYIPIMGKIPPTIFEDFGDHISRGNLWLLSTGNDVIGMVVLTPNGDHLLLQSMAIGPIYQGVGFGRTLLEFSEKLARSMGMSSIKLYTNSLMERNQKIYKKNGYRETHRTAYDWGWRVHMEKRLSVGKQSRLKRSSHALSEIHIISG
jgi:ribosomal protein S18 acetylase RimI-like enzyme